MPPPLTLPSRFILMGAISAALAVALGAFGKHALQDLVTPALLETWRTGAHYHLIHSLGLILAGVVGERSVLPRRAFWSGWLMIAGIVLFSGSLYLMVLADLRLGWVTPLGGFCFLGGWLMMAAAARGS